METVETFDLLEFQQKARELCCPKKLFSALGGCVQAL